MDQIEQANANMTRAEAALSSSAASVELSASVPTSVLVDGEGKELSPGTTQYVDVTGRWELVVPDAVRVRVQAGAGSRNLVAEYEAAKDGHDRLCAQGGVGNLGRGPAGGQTSGWTRRGSVMRLSRPWTETSGT